MEVLRLEDFLELMGSRFTELSNVPEEVQDNTLVVIASVDFGWIIGYVVEDRIDENTTLLCSRPNGQFYLEDIAIEERRFVIEVIQDGQLEFKEWRGKKLIV